MGLRHGGRVLGCDTMTADQLLQRLQDGERQLRVRLYVWCDLTVEGGPGD